MGTSGDRQFSRFCRLIVFLGLTVLTVASNAQPLPKARCEEFGANLCAQLGNRINKSFTDAFDVDGVVNLALANLDGGETLRNTLRSKIQSQYAQAFSKILGGYTQFEMTRYSVNAGLSQITIRTSSDDDDWMFNYFVLTLDRGPGNSVRIVDVRHLLMSEPLSVGLRRLSALVLQATGKASSKTKEELGEMAGYAKEVVAIEKFHIEDKSDELVQAYDRLPPNLKLDRKIWSMRMSLEFGTPLFGTAVKELMRSHPQDVMAAFFVLFDAFLAEKYAQALPAIDVLEKQLGPDRYFNYLRAQIYSKTGEFDKAIETGRQAMGNPPKLDGFSRFYVGLFVEKKNYPEVATLLAELERNAKADMYAVIRGDDRFIEFFKTDAFRKWMSAPEKHKVSDQFAEEAKNRIAGKTVITVSGASKRTNPMARIAAIRPREQAPAPVASSSSKYQLKAILYSKNSPSALINNKSVFVGEKVEGATVVKIDQTTVTLDVGGKTEILVLQAK